MLTELQQIQDFYKSHYIPLSTEWLGSCIEWCKDGNLAPTYTFKDLQRKVYEQWLLLDLRDTEVASLPRNLSNEKKYCLTGSYCLQMMQVIDISKPKLWQLQRIRNNVAKNTEAEKDFGKRVLQLTLTDGVQQIEAMEFQTIRCLNINLLPGTKIRIAGPLMVRNGRLMLKEENVKHLGGSVDELRVQYAAENVLARELRLEENPNPYVVDENALEISDENTTTQTNRTNSTVNIQYGNIGNNSRTQNQNYKIQPIRNNPTANQSATRNNQSFLHSSNTIQSQNIVSNRQNYNQDIPPEFQVDDDLLRELEADFEENPIRNTRSNNRISDIKPNQSGRSRECDSPDLFEDLEIDEELLNEHLDQIDVMDSNIKSPKSSEISRGFSSDIINKLEGGNSNIAAGNIGKSGDKALKLDSKEIVALDDSFDDIDIDSHLDTIDKEMAALPSSTQIRIDLTARLGSPELKSTKKVPRESETLGLNLRKPLSNSKRLTQGNLNFGTSRIHALNLPAGINLNSQEVEDDNPFSIHKKNPQTVASCSSNILKPLQKLPQDFEYTNFPSTSSKVSQNSKSLSPETLSSSKTSNVLTIEKLKKILPNIGQGKFKIKGKLKTVAEKLQYGDGYYHFIIVVEDNTGVLTVRVHSDLVATIAGVGAEELGKLKDLVLQQDDDAKRQIMNALSNIHQRCLRLDDILEIQVTRGEKYPVVINII